MVRARTILTTCSHVADEQTSLLARLTDRVRPEPGCFGDIHRGAMPREKGRAWSPLLPAANRRLRGVAPARRLVGAVLVAVRTSALTGESTPLGCAGRRIRKAAALEDRIENGCPVLPKATRVRGLSGHGRACADDAKDGQYRDDRELPMHTCPLCMRQQGERSLSSGPLR